MRNIQKYFAAFVGIAILIFLVWYFSAIVAYILVAVVLSFVGRPLVEMLGNLRIGRFGVPRSIAAALTLAVLWTVFILFFYYLTPLVIHEFGALKEVDYTQLSDKLKEPILKLNYMLSEFYDEPMDVVEMLTNKLRGIFTAENTVDVFNSLTGMLSRLFIALFSISFMTFFFLKDSGLFMKGVAVFTPSKYESNMNDAFMSIKKLLVRYFLGVFLEVIIIFILLTIGLSIIGIPINTALTIGLIASLLNIIPYIGPLLGSVIGLFIILLNNINLLMYEELLPLVGISAIVFACVQLIDNLVLQPFIYSSSVFAHPLEIFLLILIAGSLAGPIGMILAVPAYTILRVVGYEFFAQYEIVKRLTKGISYDKHEGKSTPTSNANL